MTFKLDHTPHPLVEDHYHIRDLLEKQEKRAADRTYHQDVEKQRDQFVKDAAGFPDLSLMPFWCRKCKQDFHAKVRKEFDAWGNFAFYRTKHRSCGSWCIRHISDRGRDPYWMLSRAVATDRDRHRSDLIQPFEEGFNMLYGKNYNKK